MEKTTIYIGKVSSVANMFIGNLTSNVDDESLRAAFIPFGEIKAIEIPTDPMTGTYHCGLINKQYRSI